MEIRGHAERFAHQERALNVFIPQQSVEKSQHALEDLNSLDNEIKAASYSDFWPADKLQSQAVLAMLNGVDQSFEMLSDEY